MQLEGDLHYPFFRGVSQATAWFGSWAFALCWGARLGALQTPGWVFVFASVRTDQVSCRGVLLVLVCREACLRCFTHVWLLVGALGVSCKLGRSFAAFLGGWRLTGLFQHTVHDCTLQKAARDDGEAKDPMRALALASNTHRTVRGVAVTRRD